MSNGIKAGTAALAGLAGALWGWYGWMLVVFVVCLVLDYVTGTVAAMKCGEWSSSVAREGLWHKLGSITGVLVAGIADIVVGLLLNAGMGELLPLEYSALVSPVVTVWYIVTELGSITENAGRLGAPVPQILRKVISSLHKAAGEEEAE